MVAFIVLLAAVFAVVNGRPELTDGPGKDENLVLETTKTTTRCSMNLEVVYPADEGESPYPKCSSWCQKGGGLWIDGVVVKRMSKLEGYGLMVEMTYRNGILQSCKMVPYETAEKAAGRQEAPNRCMESVSSIDTESQDEALVLSVTERIPQPPSRPVQPPAPSPPTHQRLEGFTELGDSLYRVSPNAMSWHSAVKYCAQLGASLALIESGVEQHNLKVKLSTDVWIGLNDIVAEGIFVNEKYTPIRYSNFKPGEPNSKGDEDCVMLFGNQQLLWNDEGCSMHNHALCEHPRVDMSRERYSCPSGYWKYKSSCFILSGFAHTYGQGEAFCLNERAYPVFINTLGEQRFLEGKLSEPVFIGYDDRNNEGRFLSSRFGIPLAKWWNRNEPNNKGYDEDCVSIEPRYDFFWNDVPCDSNIKIVCEKAAQIQY